MVNIGIEESGITTSIPEVIRKSKLDNLLLFADDNEKNIVNNSYKEINKTKENIEKYPLLKKENLYKLKDNKEETILTDFFNRTLMIDTYITNKKYNKEIKQNLNTNNIYLTLNQMDKQSLKKITTEINKNIQKIEPSIMEQAAKNNIKQEYQIIQIQKKQIRNRSLKQRKSLLKNRNSR